MREACRVLDELDLGCELSEIIAFPPQTDRQSVGVQGTLDEAAYQAIESLCGGRSQVENGKGVNL